MTRTPTSTSMVLCALPREARALRRALRDLPCEIQCCGPGARMVHEWAKRGQGIAHNQRVILAGLAGGLREEFAVGSAHIASEVRDANGRFTGRPPLALAGAAGSAPAIITSAGVIVLGRNDRAALAASSGADLVDLESVAFAMVAQSRGWRWGIVRGVSDDPQTVLPRDVAQWVAPDGRTRPLAVARSLLCRRTSMRDVLALQQSTRTALAACADSLRSLLRGPDQKNC